MAGVAVDEHLDGSAFRPARVLDGLRDGHVQLLGGSRPDLSDGISIVNLLLCKCKPAIFLIDFDSRRVLDTK